MYKYYDYAKVKLVRFYTNVYNKTQLHLPIIYNYLTLLNCSLYHYGEVIGEIML